MNFNRVKRFTKHLFIAGQKVGEREERLRKKQPQKFKKEHNTEPKDKDMEQLTSLLKKILKRESTIIGNNTKSNNNLKGRILELEKKVDEKTAKNYKSLQKIEKHVDDMDSKMYRNEDDRKKRQERLEKLEKKIQENVKKNDKDIKAMAEKIESLEKTYQRLKKQGYSSKQLEDITKRIDSSKELLRKIADEKEHDKILKRLEKAQEVVNGKKKPKTVKKKTTKKKTNRYKKA